MDIHEIDKILNEKYGRNDTDIKNALYMVADGKSDAYYNMLIKLCNKIIHLNK